MNYEQPDPEQVCDAEWICMVFFTFRLLSWKLEFSLVMNRGKTLIIPYEAGEENRCDKFWTDWWKFQRNLNDSRAH